MTVFIAQGWMRWPLRCRARELRLTDGTSGSRGRRAIKRRRACLATRVSAKLGRALRSAQARSRVGRTVQVHVRAAVRSNQAACRQKRQFLGTCSRPVKSIRVRNAGEELRQWPVRLSHGLDHCPCAPKACGMPVSKHAGAAGAVFAQPFRTPLSGKRNKDKPASPGAG